MGNMELTWFSLGRPNLDFGEVAREVFIPAGDAQIGEELGSLKARQLKRLRSCGPKMLPRGLREGSHYLSQPSLLHLGLFLQGNNGADIRKPPS